MAPKKLSLHDGVQRIVATTPSAADGGERPPSIPYPISTQAPAGEIELPAQAGLLSEQLQGIARHYLGARRRSGEALLEAARWLSEARALAEHGQWQVFLEATSTSDDTAERLLHIHREAMHNPQFADSVRTNWISQSVAALLARPSTAPEVVSEVLASPAPPTVAEVQRKLRQTRPQPDLPVAEVAIREAQNPQLADFAEASNQAGLSMAASVAIRSLQMLQHAAALVRELASTPDTIPTGTLTEQAVADIENSVVAIRQALVGRTPDGA